MSPVKLEAGRNFANKLWNATRFVVRSIPTDVIDLKIHKDTLPVEDRWILSRLSRTETTVNKMMADFQFGEALSAIYDFLWSEYCDWYIELAKIRLNPQDKEALSPLPVLVYVLETALRLLHPFMPFLTEELWQNLKNRLPTKWQKTESIMVAKYPKTDKEAIDAEAEKVVEAIIDITRALRNIRAENKVESTRWITADVYSGQLTSPILPYSSAIQTLARVKPLELKDSRLSGVPGEKFAVAILKEADVVVPVTSMVDIAVEREKIQKEIAQLEPDIARLEARLKDEAFLSKAPAAVVAKERERLSERKEHVARLKQQIQ
jgi:valyl-tRNA synthetase